MIKEHLPLDGELKSVSYTKTKGTINEKKFTVIKCSITELQTTVFTSRQDIGVKNWKFFIQPSVKLPLHMATIRLCFTVMELFVWNSAVQGGNLPFDFNFRVDFSHEVEFDIDL